MIVQEKQLEALAAAVIIARRLREKMRAPASSAPGRKQRVSKK